ncbi:MAG: hypothetical protein EAZ74_00395 [Alphaproteobacteria bacterium]|nr:MAG: hypothetical protein EAY76_02865 [Alphaproteobacteria bacterium]TAF16008.1 MAG: hypothetical protein EAZ74_00395 [Alphaproteobacteria bacterium]TAF76219.1 MAG: hypothetical protein EAZ52_04795 [Alphaproteobacteria bacterium]
MVMEKIIGKNDPMETFITDTSKKREAEVLSKEELAELLPQLFQTPTLPLQPDVTNIAPPMATGNITKTNIRSL